MLLILGLIILIGAAVVGAVAVLDNRGASHQPPGGFHAFGHVFHSSSGQLFFWGAVVGAAAVFGLFVLIVGLRRDLRLRARARRAGRGRDGGLVAQDDRDREREEDLSATTKTTETTRDRESEPVRDESERSERSEDDADHDGAVKA